MKTKLLLAAALTAALTTHAAPKVEIIAGTGKPGHTGDGGPATAAQVNNPFGIVRGPDGLLYFCEFHGHVVRRIAQDGTITTIAGTGTAGGTGDGGPATQAQLNQPHEIRFDANGDLYISDMNNYAIRKVDMKTGTVSTFAGINGKSGTSGDGGPANAATMKLPISIQFNPDKTHLYICDVSGHAIRRVDMKTGIITTYAGTGKPGPTPDGSPIAGTPLFGPRSLDFDTAGNLWLVTREGNQVLKFDTAGKIHHIAGTGKKGFTGNGGPAKQATLNGPKGIALAPDGTAYIADTETHTIRKYDPKTDTLHIAVGTGTRPTPGENFFNTDPLKTKLARPHGIYIDTDNTLLIGDSENHVLLRVIN